MDEVKRARDALAAHIFASVKEFESQFPGAIVQHITALHERGMSGGPTVNVEVEVRL